jgi:signal transduction histidine kinase
MKTDFVSFVTHQLRTPLSGIKWMLELAREEPTAETATTYLQDAAGAAERLITMVNELLTITRLEAGRLAADFKTLDLAVLTRTTVDDVKALVAAKGTELTVAASPAPVHGDPQLLRQLLATLVSNAVKYTPPGGRIDISLETGETTVLWAIRDTGVGIPKADQARVFEKFYRADNVVPLDTEGTGLGLHLARLIAEQVHGRIWFESEEGQGSVFFVELPRGDGAETEPDVERATGRGGLAF